MYQGLKVAVVGATGLLGQDILDRLHQGGCEHVYALASERSVGRSLAFGDEHCVVEWSETFDFSKADVVLMAAGREASLKLAPMAIAQGCWVIDKSSAFREDQNVPLVIPEVNGDLLEGLYEPSIIASPNCSVTPIIMALAPLHDLCGIVRVNVSTYQSVSGSGRQGVEALLKQSCAKLNAQELPASDVYPSPIAFNCLPWIGKAEDNGYTDEEMKLHHESRKILRLPHLIVNATAVRVPVFYGHAASVHVACEQAIDVDALLARFSALGIEYRAEGPTQAVEATGNDQVWVGRCRLDLASEKDLNFWVVTDNLRKGAVSNAFDILNTLLEQQCIHTRR